VRRFHTTPAHPAEVLAALMRTSEAGSSCLRRGSRSFDSRRGGSFDVKRRDCGHALGQVPPGSPGGSPVTSSGKLRYVHSDSNVAALRVSSSAACGGVGSVSAGAGAACASALAAAAASAAAAGEAACAGVLLADGAASGSHHVQDLDAAAVAVADGGEEAAAGGVPRRASGRPPVGRVESMHTLRRASAGADVAPEAAAELYERMMATSTSGGGALARTRRSVSLDPAQPTGAAAATAPPTPTAAAGTAPAVIVEEPSLPEAGAPPAPTRKAGEYPPPLPLFHNLLPLCTAILPASPFRPA
jgi:hypothetical protein